ncbi:MAG: cbb3-type cytochrome c oxidase subunit 3 [Pseudobdellovibrionaceae bacterium]|nr:cbb3-type cytochrome c oxidase subunit 3 [Bdellovibrionales bacterium]USN48322.1 MAG: cbb3-type cytochrome c oxidase subunit 3 [Pseudobdellovibrionaceae bacterium]
MLRESLRHLPPGLWTLVGLLVTFTIFLGIIWWVYRKQPKKHYDQMAHLPLTKDEQHERG